MSFSKEEIEKAKEKCNSIIEFCKNNKECQENRICADCYIEIEDVKAIETLLQYTKELEQEKESTYWKGYIQKQNEATEICKMCKYRKQYLERNRTQINMSKEEIEKAKERLAVQAATSNVGCEDYPNCICMKKDLIIALNYITQLEQENNKQNKMIDEMLDEYEYNARCNLKNFCDEEMRKDKCIQDCRICIKQYFEKKVEKENE